MKTKALAALAAAAAFLPGAAQAQTAGHTWRHGGGNVVHQGGGVRGGFVGGGFFGGGFNGGNSQVIILPGNWGQFHYQPLRTGAVLHPFWFAPQFHVRNWQRYGFARPAHGFRWVRHFNDAYLIDDRGHIRDFRHGLDWDRYGERWGVEGGIPRYVGDGEFEPDGRDYAYVESRGQSHAGWDYSQYGQGGYAAGAYAPPPPGYLPPPPGAVPMPPVSYGAYGAGGVSTVTYGGYGGGVITITETTTYVNQAAQTNTGYVEEIVEEVIERPRVVRRARARSCNCTRPRVVRPPAGERG